ncbi:hypothetical protein BVRB_9g222050 isoform A [Beta vulgaris subsp. vulgaris]|uniref:uncharacterized protein LOC104904778 isoform X2 n=1 Tax=Beta vulgaris subsp. vulgaris TaxID=3555 RepID=UPI0005400445|nr:uncharacterized protein LOC104904778 isoform X2 [Beta vulgaris subsp. vulgaris]KMT00937.1 hypothetical protein BVRB_9g222050 isoform A [Beta vulgaris subsp. vulgaris]
MPISLLHRCRRITPSLSSSFRQLRSDATLEAIAKAAAEKTPIIALYNYPSFSGAFSALFTHLFHSHLHLPCLVLPFSSVVPFRVEDLCFEGLKTCYFLDFIGPKGFAVQLSRRTACEVICFDHRKSTFSKIPSAEDCSAKLTFHVDVGRSSSRAVYEYFSGQLECMKSLDGNGLASSLLNSDDQCRIELLLNYLEDGDLRQWRLPDIRAFSIGISEWRSKLNCITNPHMYEQLLEMSAKELIMMGNSKLLTRKDAAKEFMEKVFKLRLGRGLYGECLGVRADSNPDLSDEVGKELSFRSAAAGLRNLKVCLRSTDGSVDTSEIAKAYGGGGSPCSSSFIIRMDEYNTWRSVNLSS